MRLLAISNQVDVSRRHKRIGFGVLPHQFDESALTEKSKSRSSDLVSTDLAMNWQVIHTKPRQEKALANDLEEARVECFLPMVTQRRTYGHRRRTVQIPLFAGYLFLRGDRDAGWMAMRSNRVVRVIPIVDQIRFDHEMKQIRLALDGQAHLDPYPFVQRGRRVRIAGGPFAGLEGMVEDRLKCDRIILIVHSIGQAASLEIDAAVLEPLDDDEMMLRPGCA